MLSSCIVGNVGAHAFAAWALLETCHFSFFCSDFYNFPQLYEEQQYIRTYISPFKVDTTQGARRLP